MGAVNGSTAALAPPPHPRHTRTPAACAFQQQRCNRRHRTLAALYEPHARTRAALALPQLGLDLDGLDEGVIVLGEVEQRLPRRVLVRQRRARAQQQLDDMATAAKVLEEDRRRARALDRQLRV